MAAVLENVAFGEFSTVADVVIKSLNLSTVMEKADLVLNEAQACLTIQVGYTIASTQGSLFFLFEGIIRRGRPRLAAWLHRLVVRSISLR